MTAEQIVLLRLLREFAVTELGDSDAVIQVEATGDTVRALVASLKFAGMAEAVQHKKLWDYILMRAHERSIVLPLISYVKTVDA